jgi:hypothetical protein
LNLFLSNARFAAAIHNAFGEVQCRYLTGSQVMPSKCLARNNASRRFFYPTAVSFCGTGLAVVSDYGTVAGDADTGTVGPAPEGVACSPDGGCAVAAIKNMSTVAKSDPNYSSNGTG